MTVLIPDLLATSSFPEEAPYRVTEMMTRPGLMLALAIVQLVMAGLMSRWTRPRPWWAAAGVLLAIAAVFFALANWGTSDIARFNHFLGVDPTRVLDEPFWLLLAPLIVALPYRMASVQGLVAAGYALVPMLLARSWGVARWGGWWALGLIWSPLLRNFLQNGVTRQALATVLITPVLVRAAGWARPAWPWLAGSVLASALAHHSLPGTLALALLPALLRPGLLREGPRLPLALEGRARWIAGLLLLAGAAVVLALIGPLVLDKVEFYFTRSSYFNSYALKGAVFWMEAASFVTVLLTIWRARLRRCDLAGCHESRTVLVFTLLLVAVQITVWQDWGAPITSRFLDPVGLIWMLSLMAFTRRHGCPWALIPVLLVSGVYFIDDRIIFSGTIRCHVDDQFLCLPDRPPWAVTH
ncbi:hypothetical protein EVJ50_09610 [Synechococcus sp. RSCCF101]|uniref:hypothetical protein n=1 Tax=Synechococcus sp. RSCCF101 TaxID=2511069 RepID=UPI001244961A|nr:hypothetical protein [Synechococcus sp. RSCCF101]QEY32436.1 hypothetical protein EVJ50_09610 [Synechococcus sp. RSCCF101]